MLQAEAAALQEQAALAERERQAPFVALLAERNAHKDPERAREVPEEAAGRYVTSKGLKHSCHVVGVMEAVPHGVSTAVDAFLARLVDRRMVMVDGRDGRVRMGPAFDQWEAPNRNKPFGRSRKRSAVPSMKEP